MHPEIGGRLKIAVASADVPTPPSNLLDSIGMTEKDLIDHGYFLEKWKLSCLGFHLFGHCAASNVSITKDESSAAAEIADQR